MSSSTPTSLAGASLRLLDRAFEAVESPSGETTLRFGDGIHGAALPRSSSPLLEAAYAAGGGASGNVAAGPHPQPEQQTRSSLGNIVFDARDHYSGVLMQQGRVQTDADCNEASTVDRWRALLGHHPAFDVAKAEGGSGGSGGSDSDHRP